MRHLIRPALFTLCIAALVAASLAQSPDMSRVSNDPSTSSGQGMRWRPIGPFRGGRTKAITGVPSQPNVFYAGAVNGGVWKTNDFGRTWTPIFDDQPTGSIGAIAVAPSDPNIVYVGSGEGLARPDLSVGDGIYKSTDAGKTWTHLGLRDGQQIPMIVVDPRDANKLFVAVLGHPYGPNAERGIYRSTDGGRTFEKVLSKDENTGGSDLEFDPKNPDIVYACLWEQRQGPWENGAWAGTHGGIFKSTDGGRTWNQLTKGLPVEGVVQADVAVAPSDPNRIYASVATGQPVGIYRSDDAGESWTRITTDTRPAGRIGGGDLPVPVVSPKDRDTVVIASTVSWKSIDGGKTWTALRGAPGGDDYQRPWINPNDPNIIALASDQGAIVTVNGGQTWSSWYNQPTSQMYHVNADNAFPYRVCGGQQESGSACVSSRGNDGMITFREWHPVGVEEYGYAVPDPLNDNIIYGGKVTRYDRRIAQVQNIAPTPVRPADFRTLRTAPVVFSTVDPHVMFFGANTLWKTLNGGRSWQKISPDLTRATWDTPSSVGLFRDQDTAKPTQRGVIYTVAPSHVDLNRIWIGTDDGLIQTTIDGGATWQNVTPPDLKPWMKVSIVDAGRFDANTAYAAINTLRLDDMRPHLYRTHDGGKTWTTITTGIPDIAPSAAPTNAIREDPIRKGLLFAGTEREVYVSFDDGDHWQSLRLNMPASSIRDVIVHNDDLIAGTHGRGIWILDDISPLRQIDSFQLSAIGSRLFKPQVAYRVRQNTNTDTPIPPDEAAGQNPPDGAIVNYALARDANLVTLEILDAAGKVVRRYSSDDPAQNPTAANAPVPLYWYRAPHPLAKTAGLHRFTWDVHYQSLTGIGGRGAGGLPIAAVPYDTVPVPIAPWAAPGQYTVKLTVDGTSSTQPLTLKVDPRVKTAALGLQQQFTLSKQLYDGMQQAQQAAQRVRASNEKLAGDLTTAVQNMNQLLQLLQGADVTPTTQLVAAVGQRTADLKKLLAQAR
jgi:photosystem II stability/assembly factor-like uncharacterized protein